MRDHVRRATAEFVGTFFLVFIGVGSIMVEARTGALGQVGVALAFGFAVLTMVYAVGHVSGAHLNPAVTLGFWSLRRLPASEVPGYVIAQTVGAILAASVLRSLISPEKVVGTTIPSVAPLAALGIEAILTFALMFVITAVATDVRAHSGFAGLAIGLTVAMDALMGGPLTGGSMNPARTLGPALVSGDWTHHWVYWFGPGAGAVGAAWTYEFLRRGTLPSAPRIKTIGIEET